jgi:tRNA-(ms[2]io[6]A)-hydroxylase
VLSENIKDPELAKFYRDQWKQDIIPHSLASQKKYTDNIDVDKRWKEWIEFETSIIVKYGKPNLFTDK